MRRRALIGIAAAVLAGGCTGSAGPGASPVTSIGPQSVAASPSRTQAAGTSRVALSFETTSAEGRLVIASVGVLDFRTREADIVETYTLPTGHRATAHKIFAKGFAYFSSSAQPAFLRRKETSPASQVSYPGSALDKLAGVSGRITRVGAETLRGARTTHFSGTIDEAKLLSRASAETRAAIKRAGTNLVPLSQPFDVWIDDQGRLRKYSQHITTTTGGKKEELVSTSEYYDFGVKADIKPPEHYEDAKS